MKKFHVVLTRTFIFEVIANNRDEAIYTACDIPASEAIEEGSNQLEGVYEVNTFGNPIDSND